MARSFALLVVVALYIVGLCHADVTWPTLTNVTIAKVPPQEFRTLTTLTLRSIPPQAFGGLLPAQMQEIPPSAIPGLTRDQMINIANLVCGVFSVDQSAFLPPGACRGFQPECIRELSSQALSAFTGQCVAAFPVYMIPMLTIQQFTSIPPKSLQGLICDQVNTIENRLVSAITPDMLSNLSRACCFLDGPRVHHLQEDTLKALTSSCIEEAGETIFHNIGVVKFFKIPKRAYSGIRFDQAMKMDRRIVDALSLEDLLDTLSGPGMIGLLSEHTYFRDLMYKYGMALVRNLTTAHIYPENDVQISSMRDSIKAANLNPNMYVVHWTEISHRLESTNWLEVYLLSADTPASVFTDAVVRTMMEFNFFGLTVDMFKKVPVQMFKHATADDVMVWPYELVSAITQDIFHELSADAFVTLYEDFYQIPLSWVPYIPISAIPRLELWGMYCEQALALTAEQLAVMTPDQLNYVAQVKGYCPTFQPMNFVPLAGSPVYGGTPDATPSIGATPSTDGTVVNTGLTVGGVLAIIFAIAVVIQSSIIGYHIYNKRRRNGGNGQYDQL